MFSLPSNSHSQEKNSENFRKLVAQAVEKLTQKQQSSLRRRQNCKPIPLTYEKVELEILPINKTVKLEQSPSHSKIIMVNPLVHRKRRIKTEVSDYGEGALQLKEEVDGKVFFPRLNFCKQRGRKLIKGVVGDNKPLNLTPNSKKLQQNEIKILRREFMKSQHSTPSSNGLNHSEKGYKQQNESEDSQAQLHERKDYYTYDFNKNKPTPITIQSKIDSGIAKSTKRGKIQSKKDSDISPWAMSTFHNMEINNFQKIQ